MSFSRLPVPESRTDPYLPARYIDWLSSLLKNRNEDGSLQIMYAPSVLLPLLWVTHSLRRYTIHGEKHIPETELPMLDGHKSQKPVRIGNGAAGELLLCLTSPSRVLSDEGPFPADHLQLDIYGELLDAIYLSQKMSKPLSFVSSSLALRAELTLSFSRRYDNWVLVRSLVDYVCTLVDKPDLSIWEVRGEKQHFVYSKVRRFGLPARRKNPYLSIPADHALGCSRPRYPSRREALPSCSQPREVVCEGASPSSLLFPPSL